MIVSTYHMQANGHVSWRDAVSKALHHDELQSVWRGQDKDVCSLLKRTAAICNGYCMDYVSFNVFQACVLARDLFGVSWHI